MTAAGWFGEIPDGWEVVPLYGIASERKIPNKGLRESNLLSLSYGRIVRKDIATSEGLLPASFETYQIVSTDDIVLRMTDLQNDQRSLRSAIVGETGIITSAYLALALRNVDPRFISYQFRAIDLMKVFYSMGGGLRQSIGFGDLKRLSVLAPPLEEQRAIADYLDRETVRIDAFIAKNEELIALLTERRLSAITFAVTEATGTKPTVALRHVTSVIDCKHVTAEPADGDDSFAVASVREVADRWVDVGNARRTTADSFKDLGEGGRTLRAWDLLVCRNASVGKVSITPPGIEPTVMGQDVSLIRTPDANPDLARFLHYVLTSAVGVDGFEQASIGSTFKRINVDDIKSLRVPNVDPSTARRVADELETTTSRVDEAIATAKRGVALARERRAALISDAVTGKIDVGVAA